MWDPALPAGVPGRLPGGIRQSGYLDDGLFVMAGNALQSVRWRSSSGIRLCQPGYLGNLLVGSASRGTCASRYIRQRQMGPACWLPAQCAHEFQ